MNGYKIELFMPVNSACDIQKLTECYKKNRPFVHMWFWAAEQYGGNLPENTTLLTVDSLTSSSLFKDMAERATGDFVLFVAKPNVELFDEAFSAMLAALPDDVATLVQTAGHNQWPVIIMHIWFNNVF